MSYYHSSRKVSKKPINANHLLQFNVERKIDKDNIKYSNKNKFYSKNYISSSYSSPEQYLQSNFQFIVSSNFKINHQNPDQFTNWNDVELVIYREQSYNELLKCPICLDTPITPRITKCGHIFCLSCLFRMFQAALSTKKEFTSTLIPGNVEIDVNHKFTQCPICTEMIGIHLLKPVKIIIDSYNIKINSQCEFVLLKRNKNSIILQLINEYKEENQYILPNHLSNSASFCRFHTDNNNNVMIDYYTNEIKDIECAKLQAHEDEINYFNLTLYQLKQLLLHYRNNNTNNNETNKDNNINSNIYNNNYNYCYQEISGKRIFLHPLCTRALLNEYENYNSIPNNIKGRVIELEEITITEQIRKRYKFLSHLPLYSVCILCEIDMRSLVSKKSLEPLLGKIKQRISIRKNKKKEEKIQSERLSKSQDYSSSYEPLDIDLNDFNPLSQSINDNISQSITPIWKKEPTKKIQQIPKQLIKTPTKVRKIKGSDGESDEELVAPSFPANIYEDISFSEVKLPAKSKSNSKSKKRKQRNKQVLFSNF